MSVHRSQKKVAFSEFERQYIRISREIEERMTPIPARYQKFLFPKLYNPMRDGVMSAVLANEASSKTDVGRKKRDELLRKAVRDLMAVNKPLIALWNLRGTEQDSIDYLTDMLNREMGLLFGIGKWEAKQPVIVPFPKHKLKTVRFLKGMSDLHKYCYEKIGHAPQYCKDTVSGQIAEYIDTALYEIVIANRDIPTTKAMAVTRANHIQAAIDNLNAMQRPLFALWNLQDYSNNIMTEWSNLIDDELKMLEGLKNKVRERYKQLP